MHANTSSTGIIATLVLAGTLGCVNTDHSEPSNAVRVGALLPYTGELASGTNLERAILFATDQINDAGGIGGRPLYIVARDTHSDVARGRAAAEELLNDGITAIIGPDDEALAQEISPLLKASGITQISGTIAPEGFNLSNPGLTFRTVMSASRVAQALAQRMIEQGAQRTSIISVDDIYGRGLSNAISDEFTALGGTTVASVSFVSGQKQTYTPLLLEATSASPDAIVLIAYPSAGASIFQEASILGINVKWFLAPTLRTREFVQNISVSDELDEKTSITGVAPAVAPDSELFAHDFAARWAGEAPTTSAYFYYDAVALLALAMEAANAPANAGATVASLIQPLSGPVGKYVAWNELARGLELVRQGSDIDYYGASGPLNLDETGDVGTGLVEFWTISHGDIVAGERVRVSLP